VLVQHLGISWPDLEHLRLWRMATSSLVRDDTGLVWPIVALIPALPAAELRFGSAPAAAAYVLIDIASTVPVLAVLATGLAAGLALDRELASVRHVVAALAGIVVGVWLVR
jgi:hypothetical protein